MKSLPGFSRPVEVASIGTEGRVQRIAADERERIELAAALGLVDIGSLSAEVTLTREKQGAIGADGRVTAEIVQKCVVSLVPLAQSIDEPFTRRFVAENLPDPPSRAGPTVEVTVSPTEDDPPEVLTGSLIDLGPVVIEHFILAIDPYPRAPGAVLPDNPAEVPHNADDSPFAVLSGLRPGSKEG